MESYTNNKVFDWRENSSSRGSLREIYQQDIGKLEKLIDFDLTFWKSNNEINK